MLYGGGIAFTKTIANAAVAPTRMMSCSSDERILSQMVVEMSLPLALRASSSSRDMIEIFTVISLASVEEKPLRMILTFKLTWFQYRVDLFICHKVSVFAEANAPSRTSFPRPTQSQ